MEKTKIKLKPVSALNGKHFIIDGYQRGYKWGKKEILELLNDINAFDKANGIYCLQPLILRALGNEVYEVIDGQQRITTLYIVLNYLRYNKYIALADEFKGYTVAYNTRERSAEFLRKELENLYSIDANVITNEELITKDYADLNSLHTLWSAYISKNGYFDNVDVYHFFTVAVYVLRWIAKELPDAQKQARFVDNLLYHVHLIWYKLEGDNSDKVIQVFLNNNKGKIALTSSELIKALFILSIRNKEVAAIANLQINQFALEWDGVEKQLQDDKFWFFIQSDDSLYTDGTRIDYLFDLFYNRNTKLNDKLYAYRKVETSYNIANQIVKTIWENVVQLYYKLLNWYQDQSLYHLIGYIINAKIKNLYEVLALSKGKSKSRFQEALEDVIKHKFQQTKKLEDGNVLQLYALANLHYEDNYRATLHVLLLHNVLYYIDNQAGFKFPFDLYIKSKWSIEHITPQNPKDLQDIETLVQWLKDLYAYGDTPIDYTLISEIKQFTSGKEVMQHNVLSSQINQLTQNNEDITHALSNLLLLDKNTNSSLSNALFSEKRAKILAFDKNGETDEGKPIFIPIETLNAFNKTFSSKINIKNWTKEDGEAYVASVAERLKPYLPQN